MNLQEKHRLQELARRYSELASNDANQERKQRALQINDRQAVRPIVWIDEIPWHEMNTDDELTLQCEDDFARGMERFFLTSLYRWRHIQADMVLEPFYRIGKSCTNSGIGVEVHEQVLSNDSRNHIVSHHYQDQLATDADLDRLRLPVIRADREQDARNMEMAQDALQEILPVKLHGWNFGVAPWDTISMLRGVEPALIDLVERPEFIHRTMEKFAAIGLASMEQLEQEGLLDQDISSLHCTPPYVSDLPASDWKGANIQLKDTWFRGTAQMFSTVSPAMHEEFELQYMRPLMAKCGLVYYGCCEPLDNKIDVLRSIPNLRKIGVSPWANPYRCAEQIGRDYVFSCKPNPALVADVADPTVIRKEITNILTACREHGCAVEFVLKDISTVSYRPQNLITWSLVVQECIDACHR